NRNVDRQCTETAKVMRSIIVFVLICMIGVAPAFGQKDKDDERKIDDGPAETHTNLMVLDASNHYVDIKAGDIKLFEDDVEQKITYFAKKPKTQVAFVVDNTGSMRTLLDVEISTATAIANNLWPEDEAMVVRFVSRDKISVVQPWTSQKDSL